MIRLIDQLLYVYLLLLMVRAVLSWFPVDRYNPLVRLLYQVTEPPLRLVRNRLPSTMGYIDFSPFIVAVLIMIIRSLLWSLFRY